MPRFKTGGVLLLVAMLVTFGLTSGEEAEAEAPAEEPASAPESTAAPESTEIKCFRCGINDKCQHPFEGNATEVLCEKSCFKFDGYATDGKRVLMRDCGYFETTGCLEEANFEHDSAIGTICHCKDGDNCNPAPSLHNASSTLVAVLFSVLAVAFKQLHS